MGFLFPLIAIVGESVAKTIDKLNFSRNHISSRQLMLLVFGAMSISLLLFILLTKPPVPSFSLASFGLIVLIALVSFAANVFDYLSLKVDDLSLREPMSDFGSVLAGIIAYALFPTERKIGFLVVFVLGTIIMYWGIHQRRLGNFQKKGMFYLLIATILYALLPSIYKLTLAYITPEYITFFRVAAILFLSLLFFPVKNLHVFSTNKVIYGLSSGIVYAIEAVAGLYAIHFLGVVITMLLLMLGPSLRYFSGYFILKEKVRRGELISSFLLTAIVLVTIFI